MIKATWSGIFFICLMELRFFLELFWKENLLVLIAFTRGRNFDALYSLNDKLTKTAIEVLYEKYSSDLHKGTSQK